MVYVSFMSTLKTVSLSVILVLSIFFASCGDDTITNNGGNPPVETLVFERDSLSLYGTGPSFGSLSTNAADDTTILKVKLTFTSETDCIASDSAFAEVSLDDYDTTYYVNDVIRTFNNTHSYTVVTNGAHLHIGMSLNFNSTDPRYLRFKNIRVYRID